MNIVGNKADNSVGVVVIGYDNTFSNMRIASVHYGFHIKSGGNSLRNIHPLYTNNGYESGEYNTSCGFMDEASNNFYSFCYSDQFAIGFQTKGGHVVYSDCFVWWYSKKEGRHTAFKSTGKFNGVVSNMTAGFVKSSAATENVILDAAEDGGFGTFTNLFVSDYSVITDHSHDKYLR